MARICRGAALTALSLLQGVLGRRKADVGIDFGTTFSCVAIYYPDTKSYDYLTYGSPDKTTIPTTIFFKDTIDPSTSLPAYEVGYAANQLNEIMPDPHRYIGGFKRIVGIDKIETKSRLANFENEVTYKLRHKTIDGKGYYVIPVTVEGKEFEFTPTQLAVMVLNEIRLRLEQLDINVSNLCISTPAYFTTVQDDEIKSAAINAKLPSPLITKEPVAACVTYVDADTFKLDVEEKHLVFDLGGGTLDITVVETIKEKSEDTPGKNESNIIVKRFVGDNFLGGENVNSYICNEFIKIAAAAGHSFKTSEDMLRLRLFVEALKIRLCEEQKLSATNVTVSETFWFKDQTNFTFSLSHDRFNELVKPMYDRIEYLLFDQTEGLFQGRGDSMIKEIKKVVLVGGSTRIPYIRTMLQKIWPAEGAIFDKVDADKAVGMGACKISVSTDPELGDPSIMVLGAVPLPIGIRLSDGSMESLIARNVAIPTESSKIFTTVYDNQTTILIDVAMGVRPMFDDNEKIGKVLLTLKNPKPKGVPQILVKIEYFADYSFKVTAEDLETKVSESAVFKSELGRPPKDKIDRMLEMAEKFKQQDSETAKRIEELRLFEGALSQYEAQLNMMKSNTKINFTDLEKSYFDTILEGNKKWLEENRSNTSITAAIIQMRIEDIKNISTELTQKVEAAEKGAKPEEEKGRETL